MLMSFDLIGFFPSTACLNTSEEDDMRKKPRLMAISIGLQLFLYFEIN